MYSKISLVTITFVLFSLTASAADEQELAPGVMAARGNGVVTREVFDARISQIPEKDQAGFLRSADRVRKILSNLLLSSQLGVEARNQGFDQEVQQRMRLAAETELANAWLDHYVDSQPEADYKALAKEYYLVNPDDFQSGPMIDLTHLLVSTEKRSLEEAFLLARAYIGQVKSDPSVFDELVLAHSDDPSVKKNQGHFIDVKKGDMVKPFEQAAFALNKKGEISEPVQTMYGLHIIRLDEIKPSKKVAFEDVRAQLEDSQKKKHQERIRTDYLRSLSTLPTNVSDDEIKAMVERYFGKENIKGPSKQTNNE